MKVGANKVVTMDYSLYLDSGELVDSTEGRDPIEFICGKGHIMPALEKELIGMEVGDQKEITLSPEEGYGEIDPDAIRTVPRTIFPPDIELEVGEKFYVKDASGKDVPFTIVKLEGDAVTIDFNHPLAGQNLNFKVTIRGVREATPEELQRGLFQ